MLKTFNMSRICCPVGISEGIIAVFQMKKSQIDTKNDKPMTENDKSPKIFLFSMVLCIFPNFRQPSSIGTLKMVSNENMCCPLCLEKRLMQIFKRKLSGIDIDKDKISKIFDLHFF